MQRPIITEESFVRDLPYNVRAKLAEKLDTGNLWEQLASVIPTIPDNIFNASGENFEARYTMAQINNLGSSKSCTRALISDWGMQNCKMKHLVKALYQAHLNAAAAYLEEDIMHAEPRSFIAKGLPHNRSTPEPEKNKDLDALDQDLDALIESAPKNDKLIILGDFNPRVGTDHVSWEGVIGKNGTDNFDQRNYKDGGNLIGQGGFGTVLIGITSTGFKVAVKCLKDCSDDSLVQFKTEVETLAMFKHENLVQLLGYSIAEDGPCCLVYQYMSNGSLEERLACRYGTEPLSNTIRLNIIKGTAAGLAFLHKGGLVHRDIKSANILLDDTFKPKVGDFATARVLPSGLTSHIMKASVVIGTAAYLAPEALSFVIHPSLDSFSFGVVILEILTGLPVIDLNREDVDLKIHVQEHCCAGEEGEEAGTIHDLLDERGGLWAKAIVEMLYSIACHCLEHARKRRPKMDDILSELQRLDEDGNIPEVH